jgi:hypothetical protein
MRVLTIARRLGLFRRANLGGCRMIDAHDFTAALIGHALSAPWPNRKPGVRHNPAGIHSSSAGRCPKKRSPDLFKCDGMGTF